MTLLLISKMPIVVQIFDLIIKKLDIEMTVQEHLIVEENFDFIIIDDDYIKQSDFVKIKSYSSLLGFICHDEHNCPKIKDFTVPRPFLPSHLMRILQKQIKVLQTIKIRPKEPTPFDKADGLTADTIEHLADSIADKFKDESVIELKNVPDGGVLDSEELTKIRGILDNEKIDTKNNDTTLSDEEFDDLSELIDNAINEAKGYDFGNSNDSHINLILSRYSVEKLKPLFYEINQDIITRLKNGEEILLRVKLKEDKL